jgi:hypothetical protein
LPAKRFFLYPFILQAGACRDKSDEAGASSERMVFWCSGGTTLTGFETLTGFANLWLKAFPLSGGFSPEFGLGSGLS